MRERLAWDKDSLKWIHAPNSIMPSTNSTANTPRQSVHFNTAPPMMGADTGAIPLMAPTIANALARLAPLNLSVAIEREITIPPAAAQPCTKRNRTKNQMPGAQMHPNVAPKKSHKEIRSGKRRPYLSLSGPNRICPAAKPNMEKVSPNCTCGVLALKNAVMAGRLGKYISVTNGPKAVSMPKNTNKKKAELRLFVECPCQVFLVFLILKYSIFFGSKFSNFRLL